MSNQITPFKMRAQALLLAVLASLTIQLQTDLRAETTRFQPHELHLKKEIAGGSIIPLIDNNTKEEVGNSSFGEAGKMETKRAFVFEEFAICYGKSANTGEAAIVNYDQTPPKELLSAQVVVKQENRVLFTLPLTAVINSSTYDTKIDDNFTKLLSENVFFDSGKVQIDLVFPTGVTLPTTDKHYVYVRFNGLQTVVNA